MMHDNGTPNLPIDLPLDLPLKSSPDQAADLPINLPADRPTELPLLMEVWQATLGWQPDAEQYQRFQQLYTLILEGNQRLNLTRITEPTEFWEKHLWDSLSGLVPFLGSNRQIQPRVSDREQTAIAAQESTEPISEPVPNLVSEPVSERQVDPGLAVAPELELVTEAQPAPLRFQTALGQLPASPNVIDIGTGAGFPGIPVAIAFPTAMVTLLDSTRKKMAFVDGLLETLNLPNAKTLVERVEHLGQQRTHREAYDVALLRAVAPTTVCAEYALPLLKANGLAILYRGQWTADEEAALRPAIAQLGGTLEHVAQFITPLSQSKRHCLYLRKVAPTPWQFPRAVGIPTQTPL